MAWLFNVARGTEGNGFLCRVREFKLKLFPPTSVQSWLCRKAGAGHAASGRGDVLMITGTARLHRSGSSEVVQAGEAGE